MFHDMGTRYAIVAFVAYGISAGILGEVFPFSQVQMYAHVGDDEGRPDAAVPQFFADGKLAEPSDYVGFRGGDPDDITPWYRCREATGTCASLPCSMGYIPDAAAAWVREHPAGEGAPEGPVQVTYAYLMIESRGAATPTFERVVVWQGTASRR